MVSPEFTIAVRQALDFSTWRGISRCTRFLPALLPWLPSRAAIFRAPQNGVTRYWRSISFMSVRSSSDVGLAL
jgi:hypothetical protein